MKSFYPSALALSLLAVALAGTGCSSTPVNENDPASLYQDAETDVKNEHFQIAVDKFKALRNRFPYSKYAVDAQLRVADIYFLQESFTEAAGAYEAFRDLHPKHEKNPYAAFRVAKSYFKDAPTDVARDLTPVSRAIDAYNEFLKHFPDAPEAEEARKDVSVLRENLAEKELYIATFYDKRGFKDSAKPRYEKVLKLYPETKAAERSKAALEKMGS